MRVTIQLKKGFAVPFVGVLFAAGLAGFADADAPGPVSLSESPEVAVKNGAFVLRRTGAAFVPRGFNYIRLFPQRGHDTFDPEHYHGAAVEAEMRLWQQDGFNVVRVFLNGAAQLKGSLAAREGQGLSAAYLTRLADFLERAQRHGLSVMICAESFPRTAPYANSLRAPDSALSPPNAEYLEAQRIEAKALFLKDLISGLRAVKPSCLRAVFSYDLQNEFCFQVSPPFTLEAGSVNLPDGRTYRMPAQRQELADEAAIGFVDRLADVIRAEHPGALVSASVFTYAAVGRSGPGDFRVEKAEWKNRVPFRPLALVKSKADFIDLHFYAASAPEWESDLLSVEFEALGRAARERGKPLFVGEFGAFKSKFPTVAPAAAWISEWAGQFAARGFSGWLYWTYDTHEQAELWNACDGQRAIYNRLKTASVAEAPDAFLPLGQRQYVSTSELKAAAWPESVRLSHPEYERFLAGDVGGRVRTDNPGFGGAFYADDSSVVVPGCPELAQRPLTVRLRIKSDSPKNFNIFAAFEPKSSPAHWELYSMAGDGTLSLYLPGNRPDVVRSPACVTDGKWHDVAAVMTAGQASLYADGKKVGEAPLNRSAQPVPGGGRFGVGTLVEGGLRCAGWIDDVCLRSVGAAIAEPLAAPQQADGTTLFQCAFDADPALPAGECRVSGRLSGKLSLAHRKEDFVEELLPREGLEPSFAPGEKLPKNIPIDACTSAQLAEAVRRLGLETVEAESVRAGVLALWGEQVVDVQNQLSGKTPLPRGAAGQVYDEQALLRPEERTPYEVVVRRTGALLELLERRTSGETDRRTVRREGGAGSLSTPDIRLGEASLPANVLAKLRKDWELLKRNASPQSNDVFAACALRRAVVLSNPDLAAYDRLVFLARATYAGCRLTNMRNTDRTGGHFNTQCFGFNTVRGGGIFTLEGWRGKAPAVKNMLVGCVVSNGPLRGKPLDSGSFYTPEVSYDGKTVYFARCGATEHRWAWSEETTWKLFKLSRETGALTQLTMGPWNDFDPVELPSGRIAFISERRGGFIRCFTEGSRLRVPTYVLHSMKADGSDLYPLSYYETSEWQPSVDNSGMLVYTRWDYTDREDCLGSQFWTCFPDGRDPRAPHGNYPLPWHTFEDNAHGDHRFGRCADAPSGLPMTEMNIRAMPDSHRYILTAAPHHGETFGSLCVLDLREPDDNHMSQLRRVTPYVPFPESESPSRSQYAYGTAWPVSGDVFLCNRWEDLVVLDRFGNEELVCERELLPMGYDARLRLTHPRPLRARPKPPVIPQRTAQGVDFSKADQQATIGVVNVRAGDQPFPEGSQPKRLRVLQAVLKSDPWMDRPLIGYGQENTPRIPLGTVPVEPDGSAYFEAPAGKELIFQVLDADNCAIQSMRSTAFVHPGERLTCLGCHEPKRESYAVKTEQPLAFRRAPSKLEPECGPVEPVSFSRLVEPVIKTRCLSCHLKEQKGPQRMGYEDLRDYAFHFGGGFCGKTMQPVHGGSRSIPGRCGAAASRIGKALLTPGHRAAVPEEERHRVTLWLDANALRYSAYGDTAAQERGDLVWPLLDIDPAHPLANAE